MTFVFEGKNKTQSQNPGQKIDQNHQNGIVNIAELKLKLDLNEVIQNLEQIQIIE
jgi:hypothetical protein